MKMVLETIAVEGHRFSSIDQDKLLAAAAGEVTRTPTQVEHQAGITAPVVNYQATIKEAYQTAGFGQNAAQVRHDLEDILGQVRDAGFRPVLVLDDTEKFVSPGPEGTIDRTSVENLYHHGVRVLGEMELDLVVAMHPRFEDVERVTEVVQRLGLRRINVPSIPQTQMLPRSAESSNAAWSGTESKTTLTTSSTLPRSRSSRFSTTSVIVTCARCLRSRILQHATHYSEEERASRQETFAPWSPNSRPNFRHCHLNQAALRRSIALPVHPGAPLRATDRAGPWRSRSHRA